MKLAEIRAFVSVAEAGSMQQAADRLGLTQSAVSRLVQRLEADLGVILFDRDAKPLALTGDGARALGLGRRLLATAGELHDVFAPAAAPAGTARFGISHALAFATTAAPLADVRALFTGVSLRLTVGWSPFMLGEVAAGRLDGAVVALAEREKPPSGLAGRLLGVEEVGVMAARTALVPVDARLADLNGLGWVVHPEGCSYRRHLARALEGEGAVPNIVIETFGVELQATLVARGLGLGLLPLRWLPLLPEAPGLRVVATRDLAIRIAVWFVRSERVGRIAPVVDAFERAMTRPLTGSMQDWNTARSDHELASSLLRR